MRKMMKTSLGTGKKSCDSEEDPGTSGCSRDAGGLAGQQEEPRERSSVRELMFSTLQVIRDHVDILKSTQEKLIKDYGALASEVAGLKEILREENYRINIMEERISTNEDQVELQSQKIKILRQQIFTVQEKVLDLENASRKYNVRVSGIPEGAENESNLQTIIKEIIEKNFPELNIDLNLHTERIYRSPFKHTSQTKSPRHIIIQFLNLKEKESILQAAEKKGELIFNKVKIGLTPDYALFPVEERPSWSKIYYQLKFLGLKPRVSHPGRLSFLFEDERRIFDNQDDFKAFVSKTPKLQAFLQAAAAQGEGASGDK